MTFDVVTEAANFEEMSAIEKTVKAIEDLIKMIPSKLDMSEYSFLREKVSFIILV